MTGADPASIPPIFDAELATLFASLRAFDGLVVAVSGGSDSMALLHLIDRWRRKLEATTGETPPEIVVATVDHGLRTAAKDEAAFVAEQSAKLGLDHETARWHGAKPETGIQEAARAARYQLLEDLAVGRWPTLARIAIVTAHTRDDQVETFLMRLARGSGLEGLTGMNNVRRLGLLTTVALVRPLLDISKARLVATLQVHGSSWCEDPSNQDDHFERVRVRNAQQALDDLGLTHEMVSKSIARMRRANEALEENVNEMARDARLDLHDGLYARFNRDAFVTRAPELRVRFLMRLIRAFGGQSLPARLIKVEALSERLVSGGDTTHALGGCLIKTSANHMVILREPDRNPFPTFELKPGDIKIWDRRFRVSVSGGGEEGIKVEALGVHAKVLLADADGARGRTVEYAAATLPGFWHRGRLVAVPQLDCFVQAGSQTTLTDGPLAEACRSQFVFNSIFD